MEPKKRKIGENMALVFPSFLQLTSFMGSTLRPKLGDQLDKIWSYVKKPNPKKSDECLLLFHADDFKRVVEPVL